MAHIIEVEQDILLFLQECVRHPWLNTFFIFITKLGDAGWIWIAAGIILFISKKYRREGMTVLLALLIGLLITNVLLKNIVARPRPFDVIEGLYILIAPPVDFSFPSGHTCGSFAAAVTIWKLCDRKLGIPAILLAVLIAFSRLYLGVHYPTDVLAGAAVGALSAYLAIKIMSWYERKKVI